MAVLLLGSVGQGALIVLLDMPEQWPLFACYGVLLGLIVGRGWAVFGTPVVTAPLLAFSDHPSETATYLPAYVVLVGGTIAFGVLLGKLAARVRGHRRPRE